MYPFSLLEIKSREKKKISFIKWLIISSQIKKEKRRKFYCFHNTSRWHFVNPTSPGNLQLHGKIYVLVNIRDAVLRLPGSAALGSWDTGTSSKTQVLEVFPSISLPPCHNSTVPDKTLAHTGPSAEVCLGLCLLDPPLDHQILPTLSVGFYFPPSISFLFTPCLCSYTVLLLMQKLCPKVTFLDMLKHSSFLKNYSVEFRRLVGERGSPKSPCAWKAARGIIRICPTDRRWW